jgi:toxin FitB
MYLLDTNVISELRKPKPHGAVVDWLSNLKETDIHIAAISLGEIQAGIEITRVQDATKAAELSRWADALAETSQIIPASAAIFRHHAILMHGVSDALWEDALIAATALEHDLTIATRNVRDFQGFGVTVVNPFGS